MNKQIRHFIQHGGDFNDTALDLWRFQVENSVSYGRFCGPLVPKTWKEIPAVPVALFRDVAFTTFPPFLARVTFRTSGTTGQRGQHILQDTEVYDFGAAKQMQAVIGGVPEQGLSLVSPAPDSSLGHMCRSFAPQMKQGFDLDVGVRRAYCWQYLENATEAIFVPGTAFAFDALVSGRHHPCPLPNGSVIMVTGGYKGRTTALDSEDLATALQRIFVGAQIVGEYGMTELSSQLWSPSLDSHFIPPPWMKVMAVDPLTGLETTGRGQLRFFDLANHQTVMAIETRR